MKESFLNTFENTSIWVNELYNLHNQGYSWEEISRIMGISDKQLNKIKEKRIPLNMNLKFRIMFATKCDWRG